MSGEKTTGPIGGRWFQLLIGIICMSMIANLQYGWTLFVNPSTQLMLSLAGVAQRFRLHLPFSY